MDLDVLALMRERQNYERYARFIKPSALGEEAYNIFSAMGEWFKQHEEAELQWSKFNAWFCLVRHSKMDKHKLQVHKDLMEKLEASDGFGDDVQPLLLGLARRDFASRIGDTALRIADGDYKLEFGAIETLLAEYKAWVGKIDGLDQHIGEFSLEQLQSVSAPGVSWRLEALNDALGDLRRGDLVVFGKRPDTGGTTFVASEATFIAEQLDNDQVVLWVNNEEAGSKVRYRIVQSALGWQSERIDRDPAAALKAYTDLMGGNKDKIIVFDKADASTKDVEELCERYNVGLIIFDQLWKMHGFLDNGETERQTKLYNWAREISKKHAAVIAVHQAGADAEDVKWIPMGSLYLGKTGPQGEADAILMMGRKIELGNRRFLYIPKNKFHHGRKRELRNGRFELEILSDIARFKEFR